MRSLFAAILLCLFTSTALRAQIILDDFSGGGSTGVIGGTSWVGNVTFNGTTISVGGSAKNDNGWGLLSGSIDATGTDQIVVRAQLDPGNAAPFFTVQFFDNSLNSEIFQVSTSSFTTGMSDVIIPISSWGSVNPADISRWTMGGGEAPPGSAAFAMTFDTLTLSTSAVPEPAEWAAIAGTGMLAFATWRRRRAGAAK